MLPSPARLARLAAIALVPLVLAACATTEGPSGRNGQTAQLASAYQQQATRYHGFSDEGNEVPTVDLRQIDQQYLRQLVDYDTDQPPGTIIVDTNNRFLYLVMENGKAMRYGVGVGKAGMEFKGVAQVGMKRKWPRWTPTKDMIKRDPDLYGPWAKGMEGGTDNPLGARALYLFQGGKDTLFRIHGTTEPWSIGKAMSSGCIRMLNQDVMDLYNRVPSGDKVVVL